MFGKYWIITIAVRKQIPQEAVRSTPRILPTTCRKYHVPPSTQISATAMVNGYQPSPPDPGLQTEQRHRRPCALPGIPGPPDRVCNRTTNFSNSAASQNCLMDSGTIIQVIACRPHIGSHHHNRKHGEDKYHSVKCGYCCQKEFSFFAFILFQQSATSDLHFHRSMPVPALRYLHCV